MYNDLREMMKKAIYSTENDMADFFISIKNNDYTGDIFQISSFATKYTKSMKALRVHNKKRVPTDKWIEKQLKLVDGLDDTMARLLAHTVKAYEFQMKLLKLLWLTYDDCCDSYMCAPDNFFKLLDEIKIFDSYDKKTLKTFKTFRNMLSHTPLNAIGSAMNTEIAKDISDMCLGITHVYRMIASVRAKEITEMGMKQIEYLEHAEKEAA